MTQRHECKMNMEILLLKKERNRVMTPFEPRKFCFSWELLGNLVAGRPHLGRRTRLEVYRLMQFCLRDVIEEELGAARTERIFFKAGHLAGTHFYTHKVEPVSNLTQFLAKLQEVFFGLGIGILEVEEEDLENGRLLLTISEDLDCSGLPELSYEMCTYDEGFIAGLLESYTGTQFLVKEIDCWCTGSHTCRFLAIANKVENSA